MQSKLKVTFYFSVLLTTSAFCQIENLKWQKADISYEKQIHSNKRDYSFESENAGEFLTKSLTNAYWFFISDVDGDNCPFQTNLFFISFAINKRNKYFPGIFDVF